jgi:hypothetical protein
MSAALIVFLVFQVLVALLLVGYLVLLRGTRRAIRRWMKEG